MTKPAPGTWAKCACGARKRANTPGGCYACNRRANNAAVVRAYQMRDAPKRVDDKEVMLSLPIDLDAIYDAEVDYDIEHDRAIIKGHDLGPTLPDDGPGTCISVCRKCHGFLVGDPCETPPFYGRAYDTECSGAPPVRPARRRDPMMEAASTTSLANEPVGVKGNMDLMAGGRKSWAWDQEDLRTPYWEGYAPK